MSNVPVAFKVSPLKIEHPRRDPVYDAADISDYVRKILFEVALDMFGNLWDNYVTYEIDSAEEHEDSLEDSLDKKVSSEVMYDWDYLDRMEERGEMSLEELMSLYKNLYTWEQDALKGIREEESMQHLGETTSGAYAYPE